MFRQSEAISVSFAVLNDPTTDERVLYESKRIPSGSGALFESKDVANEEFTDPEMSFLTLQFLLAANLKKILEAGSSVKEAVVECMDQIVQQLEIAVIV